MWSNLSKVLSATRIYKVKTCPAFHAWSNVFSSRHENELRSLTWLKWIDATKLIKTLHRSLHELMFSRRNGLGKEHAAKTSCHSESHPLNLPLILKISRMTKGRCVLQLKNFRSMPENPTREIWNINQPETWSRIATKLKPHLNVHNPRFSNTP